jgi:hypothetical protein
MTLGLHFGRDDDDAIGVAEQTRMDPGEVRQVGEVLDLA